MRKPKDTDDTKNKKRSESEKISTVLPTIITKSDKGVTTKEEKKEGRPSDPLEQDSSPTDGKYKKV